MLGPDLAARVLGGGRDGGGGVCSSAVGGERRRRALRGGGVGGAEWLRAGDTADTGGTAFYLSALAHIINVLK